MRTDDLLGIDLAAEVATLCRSQLQGPWQVPAELVRLAVARGSARVELDRTRVGFRFRFDGILAVREELADLAAVFDSSAGRRHRQEAISRIEEAGLSALLWAAGLLGARLDLREQTGGWSGRMELRGGRFDLFIDETQTGVPSTTLSWRCRGLGVRRAVAWLRTALRFVPIPVTVCGRPVERGFPDGLYRMRIIDPLPGEIAVTAVGEAPNLWILEHGVLSTRAVIPGYPAFSAAVEMGGRTAVGSSADELRAAVNPHLGALIDEAARMLLLLVDRLGSVEEPIRQRLTTLLLGFATLGLRRDQIMESAIVEVRDGSTRHMESPSALAARAARQGGVIAAAEPGTGDLRVFDGLVVEAATEERSLLSELLEIRIENLGRGRSPLDFGRRIKALLGRVRRRVRRLVGPPEMPSSRLSPEERQLLEIASAAGVELGLCDGSAMAWRRRSRILMGRERREVAAAAAAVAHGDEWLYPALLAAAGEGLEIPDEIRERWRGAMM